MAGASGNCLRSGNLALVALAHQQCSLALLEQVSLPAEASTDLRRHLAADGGTSEVVAVSTCNRTELYLHGPAPDPYRALGALAVCRRVPVGRLQRSALILEGPDAAEHLLRVAVGLESRVVGETEIAGQVRAALGAAVEDGTAGPHLRALFRFAAAAGRRGRGAVDHALAPSLPRLTLDTVASGTWGSAPAVILGSGAIAAATARELRARRIHFVVCARRPERAARLAARPDHVVTFEELPQLLERTGLVICATGARAPLLRGPALRTASRARAGWPPLTIVDLSMPRNVDPAARQVPGVRLFDLDDLVQHSTEAQLRRREAIVSDELRRYQGWLAGQAVAPLLAQMHESVHALCRAVVAPWAATTGVEGAALERAAHRVAGKLLHLPTVTVKELIARGDEPAALRVLAAYGVTPGPTSRRHLAPSIMQEAR